MPRRTTDPVHVTDLLMNGFADKEAIVVHGNS